jgi:GH25 family lysozyme M1 (1,4-beta-N-acetylmuramidase)
VVYGALRVVLRVRSHRALNARHLPIEARRWIARHLQGDGGRPVSVAQGVDLSYCQAGLDYAQLRSAGVQFAIIRALDWSASHGFVEDSMYKTHVPGCRAAGILVSPYFFGHITPDPIQMADACAKYCDGDLPPVLDMETLQGDKIPDTAGAWAYTFLMRLEQNIGLAPWLYSFTSYLAEIGKQAPGLAHYPIWISEFHNPPSPDRIPKVPAPLMQEKLVCYQWTGSGRLPGCPTTIDRDVMVRQLDELVI